ncbi:MAG: hypothetical protein GKR87_13110 [Kiritimatiellae bacterium]|nr:hypothetical protein [Kiritimatiellia bacterium]
MKPTQRNITLFVGTLSIFAAQVVLAQPFFDGRERGAHHKPPQWETLDQDGNGSVSYEEFLKSHEKMLQRKTEQFEKLDLNGDGSLSKEEFVDGKLRSIFKKLDANNDGNLTQEEMEEGRKKRQEQRRKKRGHRFDPQPF